MAAAGELFGYLVGLIAAKREAPRDDLLSGLIEACDGEQRLDEQELLATTFLLVVAGHETTVNLIANGTVALLRNPDQLAALRADLSLVPAAVEELLRYDGPVQHATFRFTTEPIEVGGVTIPAHQRVLVLIASANRDTARFTEPDRLEVRRTDNRHLAFGHGIHFCLGAPLARLEGQIAFTSLLRRFPELQLAVPPEELHWRNGLVLRALTELPVRLSPAEVPSSFTVRGVRARGRWPAAAPPRPPER
jgi:cytochrome P450